mgnify:CR=1 FL=1
MEESGEQRHSGSTVFLVRFPDRDRIVLRDAEQPQTESYGGRVPDIDGDPLEIIPLDEFCVNVREVVRYIAPGSGSVAVELLLLCRQDTVADLLRLGLHLYYAL